MEIKDSYTFKEMELAYVAGFFDGEGYIGVRFRGREKSIQLVIEAYNTIGTSIQFIASILGGTVHKRSDSKVENKPIYRWSLTGSRAAFALCMLLPYLVIKEERARLGIECVIASKERRLEILEEMHKLNKKGVVIY